MVSDEAHAAAIMKEKREAYRNQLLIKEATAERQQQVKKAAEAAEFDRRQQGRVKEVELKEMDDKRSASASHKCTPGLDRYRNHRRSHAAPSPSPSPNLYSPSRHPFFPLLVGSVYANTGHAAGGRGIHGTDPEMGEEVKMFVPSTNESPRGFRDSYTRPGGTRSWRMGDTSPSRLNRLKPSRLRKQPEATSAYLRR